MGKTYKTPKPESSTPRHVDHRKRGKYKNNFLDEMYDDQIEDIEFLIDLDERTFGIVEELHHNVD
jgi:hypothetical protein